jgi:hypothetical protein
MRELLVKFRSAAENTSNNFTGAYIRNVEFPTKSVYNWLMKKFLVFLLCSLSGLPIFAQTVSLQVAPGAKEQLEALLNNPTMVQPPVVTPLGRNWFRVESDAHVIVEQPNFRQISAILVDVDNQPRTFDGRRSKMLATVVSRNANETIIDYVTIAFAPLGIQIKTPYRASFRVVENTESKTVVETRQLDSDSQTNSDIKNMVFIRYAEEVAIDGKMYTYLRIYTIDDANASILPGARGVLESNTPLVNFEVLQLIIAAAKTR